MAALMARDEVGAVWRAALERRERERRFTRAYTEAEKRQAWTEDRELPEKGLYDPEFRAPESAADWWDDRILDRNSSWWNHPETPALTAIAVAARDEGDLRAAVALARQLEPARQFTVFGQLGMWRAHEAAYKFGADRLVDRVLAEWERLKLPTRDPAETGRPERRRRKWETEAAS